MTRTTLLALKAPPLALGALARGTLTLGALALLALAGAPATALAQPVTALWQNNCLRCHGANGEGGNAPTLLDDAHRARADRALFDGIKNGHEDMGMPSFGGALKDEEIWGLVVHIREFQAQKLRAQTGSPRPDAQGVYRSKHAAFRVQDVVTTGLSVPWSIEFLPASSRAALGSYLVADRPGQLYVAQDDGTLSAPVRGTPAVLHVGQGGLMDVALHPDFDKNGWVYLSFYASAGPAAENERRRGGMTRIVRGKIVPAPPAPEADGGAGEGGAPRAFAWTDEQVIFDAKPEHAVGGGLHFGCRIVFQTPADDAARNEGRYYIYWAIGERGQAAHAQDLSRPNGKVHRLWDDGSVPADNPFADGRAPAGSFGSGGGSAYPSIWSYGHRNPQGLTFDLEGRLWDTEHGPRGGDELNDVLKGRNYGWPGVSFGINYNGMPHRTPWPEKEAPQREGGPGTSPDELRNAITMPVFVWTPSIGACGLDVARGPADLAGAPHPAAKGAGSGATGGAAGNGANAAGAFPAWRGDLLAGGLSGANVDRVRIRTNPATGVPEVAEREELLHGLGRVRDVAVHPGTGEVYVVLNDPDKVIKLTPAE